MNCGRPHNSTSRRRSSYSVRVRSTDQWGEFAEQSVHHCRHECQRSADRAGVEQPKRGGELAGGDRVGTLTATDPDAGDTHTYALVAGDGDTGNAAFAIVGQ